MMLAAGSSITMLTVASTIVIFLGTAAAVYLGYRPLREHIRQQETDYEQVLRRQLLLPIPPRAATVFTCVVMLLLGLMGYMATGSFFAAVFLGGVGLFAPAAGLGYLQRRRLRKLEDQLISGIQTLASGVRAGLNLVQAMQLVARDGPLPLRQEFAHLVREYEYGVGLEDAMNNAAARIGSGDYRLLFAALLTHRERGGNLGETLDRIGQSIREIQRLEKRVETLTAQGRASARWLGASPVVVLLIYLAIDAEAVRQLFVEAPGKIMLLGVLLLNVIGFLWIKKIVSVDI